MKATSRNRRVFLIAAYVGALVYTGILASGGVSLWKCPIRMVTGYSCFGCGMTRSWTHALHGDFAASVHFHPFGIFMILACLVAALVSAWELYKGETGLSTWFEGRIGRYFWPLALLCAVVFGLVRVGLEMAGILTPV